jgi:hypothetical protein
MIIIRSFFYLFILFASLESQIYGAQKITIVNPRSSDIWKTGNGYEIAWTYNDLKGGVVVEYSHTSQAPWSLIAEEQVVSQSAYYFLPNDFFDSDNRITLRVRSKSSPRIDDRVTISIGKTQISRANNQISKTDKVVFIDKQDNIRSGPSMEYPIIAKCRRGESYPYLGPHKGWFMILYNGQVAYTHSSNGRTARTGTSYTPPVTTNEPDLWTWTCAILLFGLLYSVASN